MQNDINQKSYPKPVDNASSFNFSFVNQIKNLFIMILEKISLNDELKRVLFNSKYDSKKLFSQLDFQSKGYIKLEDLEYFLKKINYSFPDNSKNIVNRKFIRIYGKKGDFTLSYDDFCYLISPVNKNSVFNNPDIISNINELFYNVLLNEFELVELINTEIEKIGKYENYNNYEAFMIIGQGQKYINNELISEFINNRYPINYIDCLIYLFDNNNDKLIDYNEFQDFFVPYKNLENDINYCYFNNNNNQINCDECKNNLCINSNIKQISKSKSHDHLKVINNDNINYDYKDNNDNNKCDSKCNINIKLNKSNGLNNNLNDDLKDQNKSLPYNDFTYTYTNNYMGNTNSFLEFTNKTVPQNINNNNTMQKFPEVFHTENNFEFKINENENQLYNTALNEHDSKFIDNKNNNNINNYPINNDNYENNYENTIQVNNDIQSKTIEHNQIEKNIELFFEKEKNINNNTTQSKYIDYTDYIKNKSDPSINLQEIQTDRKTNNNSKINILNSPLINYFLEYLQLIIIKESKIQLIKESLCLRDDITPNELFFLFDNKQRGFISINDFKFICKNILFLYPTTDQIKLVYKRYNINKNNKLNNCEFFNMINPIKEEYRDIFYSENNKNKMDMKLSMKSKNIFIDLIKVIIENESNYYEMRKKMRRAGCIWEELKNIFKEYSKNGYDDVINEVEFSNFLNDLGFFVSNYQREMLFSFFDKSKEGVIRYREVVDDLKKM